MTAAVDGAPRRVLPEGRFAGPMPWVIAIMMFLAVLAAAAAFAISNATVALEGAIAGRVTIQVVEANPDLRARQRVAIAGELRRLSNVNEVTEIGDAQVRDLLAPWLGAEGLDGDLPVPALIDVTMSDSSPSALAEIERVARAQSTAVRVDRHADWLGPLAGLLDGLRWLAIVLVGLTAAATAAAVILGAKAALDQHRATIDVMHLMGATDRQISRLFERRVAQDAISGCALGFAVAILALILLGWRLQAVEAALVGNGTLGWPDWIVIAAMPIAGVAVAILAARVTVLRSLAIIV